MPRTGQMRPGRLRRNPRAGWRPRRGMRRQTLPPGGPGPRKRTPLCLRRRRTWGAPPAASPASDEVARPSPWK
eukprot:8344750-Alexandrium_andersonii.AAC.1